MNLNQEIYFEIIYLLLIYSLTFCNQIRSLLKFLLSTVSVVFIDTLYFQDSMLVQMPLFYSGSLFSSYSQPI